VDELDVLPEFKLTVSSNRTNADILRGYSGDIFDHLEYFDSSDDVAAVIDRGLLMLMAFWSGPSVVGFKNICRVLERDGVPAGFTFRVLNIDGVAAPLMARLGQLCPRIGGAAEGYWYRAEQVFATTTVSTATDEMIQQLLHDSALPA
jgi:hypothetical protein